MAPDGTWQSEWIRLSVANTSATSGISVVGVLADHFHLFARGANQELRYAEYDGGWADAWDDLGGGVIGGTPAANMVQEGRIDVFIQAADSSLWQLWMWNGEWKFWVPFSESTSAAPVPLSGVSDRLDVLFPWPGTNQLGYLLYQAGWVAPIQPGVTIPAGDLVGVTRAPGHWDLFVTREDGSVWHGFRPRAPQSAPAVAAE